MIRIFLEWVLKRAVLFRNLLRHSSFGRSSAAALTPFLRLPVGEICSLRNLSAQKAPIHKIGSQSTPLVRQTTDVDECQHLDARGRSQ
jgi:hypothetical protein